MKKTLCYISVNEMWSGSEVLWSASAKKMLEAGCSVYLFSYYDHPVIDMLVSAGAKRFQVPGKQALLRRTSNFVRRKITGNIVVKDPFVSWIVSARPDLVIISQGNNISGRDMMSICLENHLLYLTLTQLVTEFSWLFIDDKKIKQLAGLYKKARSNYFVSKNNLELNNLMLSEPLQNAEVVYNPYSAVLHNQNNYPPETIYRVAIVGRLECMHKGLDLLLQVLCQERWQKRNVTFTFYGSGPHQDWINSFITRYSLPNITIAGYVNNISLVWEQNHILLMPSRMEGQSLALIEAMYCSRCAIVTNVGGAAEIIDDGVNGFIAANASVRDLTEVMERAWSLREEWKEMGEAAGRSIRKIYPDDPVEFFNDKLNFHLAEGKIA